ncbi:BspA family leucine-rich repeat surface protein [Bifidobacterium sp. ESL0790]|uniref:BspA family leucine-rich repeat surface protein n=1 Tax=Bifidobacterium sp. ESL0790 TaxID=2983233 RepID=UPI0023F8F3A6|nr:BspA family leucine-rich repeat surface protein [Bifidobacterium sp. ESL0790]WEV72746.1 BspA family leucine-rich repeat surface protein [Bifidobacterium sp. ESL0790]
MLTLLSGTVPENPSNSTTSTNVPWSNDSITKITVNAGVRLSNTGGRALFSCLPNLTEADVSNLDTSNAKDLWAIFWNDPVLTKIDGLDQWHTGQVTSTRSMFDSSGVLSLDLSNWDTSQVADMGYMFYNASGLKTLGNPGLDIPATADVDHMFTGATSLPCKDKTGRHRWVSGTNTLKWNEHTDGATCILTLESGIVPENPSNGPTNTGVPWTNDNITKIEVNTGVKLSHTGGRALFGSLPNLTEADVTNLNTNDATDFWAMFWNDPVLAKIDGLDQWHTGQVTSTRSMFQDCGIPALDLSNWDTSRVADMGYMFCSASNLKTLGNPGLDIPAAANLENMYIGSGLPCAQTGRHWWTQGGNSLRWNEHTDDDMVGCVLELESGVGPDEGGGDASTNIPWKNGENVTKLVVRHHAGTPGDPRVKLLNAFGFFNQSRLPKLKTVDVATLDTTSTQNVCSMFGYQPNITTLDITGWDIHNATATINMLPAGLQALKLGPHTQLPADTFHSVPTSLAWVQTSGLENSTVIGTIGGTNALITRAGSSNPEGTYITRGYLARLNAVTKLPLTGGDWQTIAKWLAALVAGILFSVIACERSQRKSQSR